VNKLLHLSWCHVPEEPQAPMCAIETLYHTLLELITRCIVRETNCTRSVSNMNTECIQ
jgi:hypothetical protein